MHHCWLICLVSSKDLHSNPQPRYPTNNPSGPSTKFHQPVFGDPRAASSDVARALCESVEAALLGWIPVDKRPCAVRLGSLCRLDNRHSARRNV